MFNYQTLSIDYGKHELRMLNSMEKVIPSNKRTTKNCTAYNYEYHVKLFILVDGVWTYINETYHGVRKGLDNEVKKKIKEVHKGEYYDVIKITCD